VNAINKFLQLDFSFPVCHEKQKEIANAFREKSTCRFDCCVGATDGLLIWIERLIVAPRNSFVAGSTSLG
jgi:hypothetical protein